MKYEKIIKIMMLVIFISLIIGCKPENNKINSTKNNIKPEDNQYSNKIEK